LNDSFVALRAGTVQPWGVVIVAGTGTVAAGRNPAGDEFRTMGEGAIFGDFGDEFDVSELAVARWPTSTRDAVPPPLCPSAL
jgi:N-acetylglucosamine kinase-like BadF-type ATPase